MHTVMTVVLGLLTGAAAVVVISVMITGLVTLVVAVPKTVQSKYVAAVDNLGEPVAVSTETLTQYVLGVAAKDVSVDKKTKVISYRGD